MTSFEKFMHNVGTSEEMGALTEMVKGNKVYEEKIIEFIRKNKIDCNHMFEDTKEGVNASRNWNKLIEFALELIPAQEN